MPLTREEIDRMAERGAQARAQRERQSQWEGRRKYLFWALAGCLGLLVMACVATFLVLRAYPNAMTIARFIATPYPTYTPFPTLTVLPSRTPEPLPTHTPQPTSTAMPTYTAYPTSTPLATYTPFPTHTTQPTLRPALSPTAIVLTSPTSYPQAAATVPRDDAGFTTYLRQNYGVIAGHPISFEQIDIYHGETTGMNSVTLRLTSDSAAVFDEQTERDAVDYGRRLLADTKAFFANQDCSAYVKDLWYTDDPWNWLGEEWYYVGGYSSTNDGWRVWQTYVKVHFLSGRDSVDVWNYK